jgi:hypothetical protein
MYFFVLYGFGNPWIELTVDSLLDVILSPIFSKPKQIHNKRAPDFKGIISRALWKCLKLREGLSQVHVWVLRHGATLPSRSPLSGHTHTHTHTHTLVNSC